jgi:hypothetical protein
MAWIGVLLLLMLGHFWWALFLSFAILFLGD